MNTPLPLPVAAEPAITYELRFQSLHHNGRAFAFPCDAGGTVHWQSMSERARLSFRRAQHGVGLDFAQPAVRISHLH